MIYKILIPILLLFVATNSYTEQNGILILTDDDLANITTTYPNIFIKYYVPWCRHCKQLGPILVELAKELAQQQIQIKIAKINVEGNEKVHDFQIIEHFPTLVYYNKGKKEVFQGDRTKDYLLNWLKKRVFPVVNQITKEQLEKIRNSDQSNVFVVYHGKPEGQKYSEFSNIAFVDNYNSYHYISETQRTQGTVELLRSFVQDIQTTFQESSFQLWLNNNDRPQVVPLDQRSITSIFRDHQLGVLLFLENKNLKKNQEFQKAVSEWKKNHNDNKMIFVTISEDHEDFYGLLEFMDLNPKQTPVVIVDTANQHKYLLEVGVETFDQASIMQFLEKFTGGKIVSQSLQSQQAKQLEEEHHHHHHHHHDHDHHHGHDHDHHDHHDHDHDHHGHHGHHHNDHHDHGHDHHHHDHDDHDHDHHDHHDHDHDHHGHHHNDHHDHDHVHHHDHHHKQQKPGSPKQAKLDHSENSEL